MINNTIGQGAFRGVPFLIVDESARVGGHRVIQHDYPLRDIGRVQNMGRRADETTINVILTGDEVLAERDTLIGALTLAEAGELEHPNFETQLVQVIEWRERISTRAQRLVSFSITYVAADIDDDSPISQQNGEFDLQSAIDSLTGGLVSDFKHYYEMATLAASRIAETIDFATNITNNITNGIRGLTGLTGLSSILGSALSLKGSVGNLFDSPGKVMGEMGDLLGMVKTLKGSNASHVYSSIHTANNALVPPNTHTAALKTAIDTLLLANQSSVILSDATRVIKTQRGDTDKISRNNVDEVNYNNMLSPTIITRHDGEKIMHSQHSSLQAVRIKTSDLYWYDTAKKIREVQQIFSEQMQLVSTQLPNAKAIIPVNSEPALVLLYRETGDALQISRFTHRNAIRHPTFVVGGSQYEVIDETDH